ncbi:MAG: tetratricopeptide repeat protein, partial [Chitinophagaceae bacterium]|nr:tetratricopeptide repeat protein [Chitinophagaceae bacterium]
MKYLLAAAILFFCFVIFPCIVCGQNAEIGLLRASLRKGVTDTGEVNTLNKLTSAFLAIDDCDSGLIYSGRAVKMAENLNYKKGKAQASFFAGVSLRCRDDYANAYTSFMEAKKLFGELGNELYVAKCLRNIGSVFLNQDNKVGALENFLLALSSGERAGDTTEMMRALIEISDLFYNEKNYEKALDYAKKHEAYAYSQSRLGPRDVVTERLGYIYKSLNNDSLSLKYQFESLRLSEIQKDTLGIANSYMQLGDYYGGKNDHEEAIQYLQKAEKMYAVIKDTFGITRALLDQAMVYRSAGKTDLALQSYRQSLHFAELYNDNYAIADNYLNIGQTLLQAGRYNEALGYFKNNLELSLLLKQPQRTADAYKELGNIYEKLKRPGDALDYLKKHIQLKDTIYAKKLEENLTAIDVKRNFEKAVYDNRLKQEREEFKAGVKIYSLLAALLVLLFLAFVLFRNNRQKQKAKLKIETAFEELKAAQQQLVQSEKMASLGQLTAGIAHEIQNPLNFVNNFSEVNEELLAEMKDELGRGRTDAAIALADDAIENQRKINRHGKRADAIVKGMLQHSRTSSGQKELTDINVLAEEYLRLAYHGLRAKDKSFNATLKTDFDETIGKINIIPQDIGRVVLNLINNAFYAVNERTQSAVTTPAAVKYEPSVTVSTKKISSKSDSYQVEIR